VLRAGALRTTGIVEALPGYRRSSVLSTLSVLARQGVIVRTGHGVYALPPAEGGTAAAQTP
jgi:predicted transcriptional regulator of viral defense system